MLIVPTVTELADFTGEVESSYTTFSGQALIQATAMFELVTGVTEWPVDVLELLAAKNGVLELADYIYESKKYRKLKSKPFASETIMNYSYTIKRVQEGEKTGLTWWDLAIEKFTKEDKSTIGFGGVIIFENENVYIRQDGEITYPGPSGLDSTYQSGYVTGYYPAVIPDGSA